MCELKFNLKWALLKAEHKENQIIHYREKKKTKNKPNKS